MRAALLQYNPAYLDVKSNLNTVERLLSGVDADLIVLPELFATGYHFRSHDDLRRVAEPANGRTFKRLATWARGREAVIVAGWPERDGDVFYNSALAVGPDGLIGVYRKNHLYYREKTFFESGDLGFPVFEVRSRDGVTYRLGIMICFDWYYPEAARTLALLGADVVAHPSNLVRKDCPRAMPIRALENHIYTITANRIGSEEAHGETLEFIGKSLICDPRGEVLYSAGGSEETVGVVEIDPELARDRQITPYNDLLADRRPKAYAP